MAQGTYATTLIPTRHTVKEQQKTPFYFIYLQNKHINSVSLLFSLFPSIIKIKRHSHSPGKPFQKCRLPSVLQPYQDKAIKRLYTIELKYHRAKAQKANQAKKRCRTSSCTIAFSLYTRPLQLVGEEAVHVLTCRDPPLTFSHLRNSPLTSYTAEISLMSVFCKTTNNGINIRQRTRPLKIIFKSLAE